MKEMEFFERKIQEKKINNDEIKKKMDLIEKSYFDISIIGKLKEINPLNPYIDHFSPNPVILESYKNKLRYFYIY